MESEHTNMDEQEPNIHTHSSLADTKPDLDRLGSKVEISENGLSEMSEHSETSENCDVKLAVEQCKKEMESSNGVGEVGLNIDGEGLEGERRREKVCEGEGGLVVKEEHMDTSEEEGCEDEADEDGYAQGSGYLPPGFGKQSRLCCVYKLAE